MILQLQNEPDSGLGCNGPSTDYLRAIVDHNDYEREYDIRELFPTISQQGFFQFGLTGKKILGETQIQQIFLIRNGKARIIAGVYEEPGYRDGPGNQALFGLGGLQGITYAAARTSDGVWYITDAKNNRIRKLTEQLDGSWLVSTFAQISFPNALMADALDNLWSVSGSRLFKFLPDGSTQTYPNPGGTATIVGMRALSDGSLLLITRNNAWDVIYKFNPATSQSVRVAGLNDAEVGAYQAEHGFIYHDGPAEVATFHSVGIAWCSPDGSEIWTGGGDEVTVRRIINGRVESLLLNGTWAEYNGPIVTQPHNDPSKPFYIVSPSGRQANGYPWAVARAYIPHGYKWVQRVVPVEVPDQPGGVMLKAQFISQIVPPVMEVGKSYPVQVVMKNVGDEPWLRSSPTRLADGGSATWGPPYTNWGNVDPQVGGGRISMPHDVQPGETVTFDFIATAPSTPGTYNWRWIMHRESPKATFLDSTPTPKPISVIPAKEEEQFMGTINVTFQYGEFTAPKGTVVSVVKTELLGADGSVLQAHDLSAGATGDSFTDVPEGMGYKVRMTTLDQDGSVLGSPAETNSVDIIDNTPITVQIVLGGVASAA